MKYCKNTHGIRVLSLVLKYFYFFHKSFITNPISNPSQRYTKPQTKEGKGGGENALSSARRRWIVEGDPLFKPQLSARIRATSAIPKTHPKHTKPYDKTIQHQTQRPGGKKPLVKQNT
jgi:hypothetical protein